MLKTPTCLGEYRLWITLCHPKISQFQKGDISLAFKCKEGKPAQTAKFTLKLL